MALPFDTEFGRVLFNVIFSAVSVESGIPRIRGFPAVRLGGCDLFVDFSFDSMVVDPQKKFPTREKEDDVRKGSVDFQTGSDVFAYDVTDCSKRRFSNWRSETGFWGGNDGFALDEASGRELRFSSLK